jgi:hypothetical protein
VRREDVDVELNGNELVGNTPQLTSPTSVHACIATAAFSGAFRWAEDYLLAPKIIGRAVEVRQPPPCSPFSSAARCWELSERSVAIPIAAALQFHRLRSET